MKANSKRKVNGPGWRAVLSYLEQGKIVVGIDEVGRGALAGPVTAGAVILPERLYLRGLNDSKLVDPILRRRLDRRIRTHAVAVGLGWASHEEINDHGLSWAVRQSGLRALADMAAAFDIVILDGNHNYLKDSHDSVAIVKADQKVASVAAASIVAKVARDDLLVELDGQYPGYGFASHKGYSTPAHFAALRELGPSEIHRTSWRPFTIDGVDESMKFGEFADFMDYANDNYGYLSEVESVG